MADITPLIGFDQMVGDETYHMRHPLLPVQPCRSRKEAKWTAAEKIAHKTQKENSAALLEELKNLRMETESKIKNLSIKYSKKESLIVDHVLSQSSFKRQRKTSLFNAEVSVRAKELRDMGLSGGLMQARADVLLNRSQRNGVALPPEREQEILKDAESQRYRKEKGARTSNLGAAKDASCTIARMESEVIPFRHTTSYELSEMRKIKKLHTRTGASAILIVTRGHLNDNITPTAFETSNMSGFCQKILGHALPDIAAKLEGWNVLTKQGSYNTHGAKDLRKKCASAIYDGEITGRDDIAMNYLNYPTAIVSRYKVQLIGWPSFIPFTNPSNLKTEHLQRLMDAVESQECRWRVMSGEEIKAHNALYDEAPASVGNTRKVRSDKNKKRSGGGTEASSTKKRKLAQPRGPKAIRQLPPQPISTEYINDSDE